MKRATAKKPPRAQTSDLENSLATARALAGLPVEPERPLFEPWGRLQMLSHAADDLPEGPVAESVREVLMAATTVVRQFQGTATRAEAYARIANAQDALRALAKRAA